MTRNTVKKTTQLLVSGMLLAVACAAQTLTQAEREHAVQYLNETRNGVVQAVKGLSEAQWKFKAGADRWSIAEIVEHLALTEDLVSQKVLVNLKTAPAGAADRDPKQVDAMILKMMPDRTTKYQAPPPIVPTGRWTPSQALNHLLESRAQTIALFQSLPDPRGHVIAHPAFGPLDGYEWVLATAGHSARHTQQILEVKADPNFPAN
jgi:DinB superfamily